jgi:hypothetical protein
MEGTPSRVRRTSRAALAVACVGIVGLSLGACRNDDARGSDRPASAGKGASDTDNKPNGLGDLSASAAYSKGTKATAAAGSLREQREGSKSSDLRLSATECVGSVDVDEMGSFEIVRIINADASDADTWVKVDAEMSSWAKAETGTALPVGTWMHGTDTNPMITALSSYCHHDLLTPKRPDGEVSKGQPTTVAGQEAVPVTLNSGAGAGSRTYYFAATGPGYVLQMDADSDGTKAKFVYSDFGTPVGAKKPAGKIVEAPQG